MSVLDRLRAADAVIRADPAFAHVSRVVAVVGGETVFDERYRGPDVLNVHSVTKSVVTTLVGIAIRRGLVPSLDVPLADVLGMPELGGQTLRHALTCTRGVRIDGAWDVDVAITLDRGRLELLASAPAVRPPGTAFTYDNGGWMLLAAALERLVGEPLPRFARRELFAPLGVTTARLAVDPEGHVDGSGGMSISADDLARLGRHWLAGSPLADPGHARAMTTPTSDGGPPENTPYAMGFWVDDHGFFAGGWGGQAVLVRPAADTVIVTTAVANWTIGDGGRLVDDLPPGWRAPKELLDG